MTEGRIKTTIIEKTDEVKSRQKRQEDMQQYSCMRKMSYDNKTWRTHEQCERSTKGRMS